MKPRSQETSSHDSRPDAAQTVSADSELELSVPDWLIEHPEALRALEQLGIDYHCGGTSLATACRERGLDPQQTLADLKSAARKGSS
jgi:regulator of cell morphogenesis and NO signaling